VELLTDVTIAQKLPQDLPTNAETQTKTTTVEEWEVDVSMALKKAAPGMATKLHTPWSQMMQCAGKF
jgi:hypothetical protein